MAMLTEPNQVGKREDLLDVLYRIDNRNTPFTSMLNSGSTPQNFLLEWPVDTHFAPRNAAYVGGTDVAEFRNHADERALLRTYMQNFREASMVSRDAVEVSNVAGVSDELGEAIEKMMVAIKRDMEATFLSSQEHQAESGAGTPYLTRGLGNWLVDTANIASQTLYQVPEAYRPAAAQYVTTATASLTDDSINTVLQSIFDTSGMATGTMYLLAGSVLRAKFTDMTRTIQAGSTNTFEATNNFNYDGNTRSIQKTTDVYQGDFGTVQIELCSYIGCDMTASSVTPDTDRGYLVDMDHLQCRWHKTPTLNRLTDNGGGPRFEIYSRAALQCSNPKAMAQFIPA